MIGTRLSDKKEGANCLAPFFVGGIAARRLEVNPQAPLNLPRIVNSVGNLAKVCGLVQSPIFRAVVAPIVWLKVIEQVGDLHGELEAHALSYLNLLSKRRVQIPTREPTKVANTTTATGVEAQDASAEHG